MFSLLGTDLIYVCVTLVVVLQGPRFNMKNFFPRMKIPIIKIRRSWDRLIFIIGIHIPVRWHLHVAAAHSMLHNFILDTGNFILDTGNFIVDTGNFILDNGNFILDTGNFILDTGNFILDTGNFILDTGNFILDNGNFILDTGNFILDTGIMKRKSKCNTWNKFSKCWVLTDVAS